MASLSEVLKKTDLQKVFFTRSHNWLTLDDSHEMESTMSLWQFSNRSVTQSSWRSASPKVDPGATLTTYPPFESILWIYESGKSVGYDPQYHNAMIYHDGPSEHLPAPSLTSMVQGAKVVESSPGVRAHGGVYDRYIVESTTSTGVMREVCYSDPATGLLRFVDTPRQSRKHLDVTNGPDGGLKQIIGQKPDDWFENSMEIRYPSEAQLEAEAPKVPSDPPPVDQSELRKRFMATIAKPESTKTVGGIQKSLYAVIVRSQGDISVVTRGGAPRSQDDPHEVEVVGLPTRKFHAQPVYASSPLILADKSGHPLKFARPRTIEGKEFQVDTTRRILLGKVPRTITVKVPVWRYDTSHPVKAPRNWENSTVYPSKFVGYATFTTDRIFEIPPGIANGAAGAQIPSDFADDENDRAP